MGRATVGLAGISGFDIISIHALRGEGDNINARGYVKGFLFQSTPSVGRATDTILKSVHFIIISIHALRGEGDAFPAAESAMLTNISIHALRGEGDLFASNLAWILYISTHALRGEGDSGKIKEADKLTISIHALRGEGDVVAYALVCFAAVISIHALRGEGDCKNIQICNAMLVHSAYKTIYFCDSCAFYLT